MHHADALTLVQENLFAHVAFVQHSLPGMVSLDLAGSGCVRLVDSGLKSDTFNKVLWNCGRDLHAVPVGQNEAAVCLQAAAQYIAASERDFSLWVKADARLPDLARLAAMANQANPGEEADKASPPAPLALTLALALQETESAMFLPLCHLSSQDSTQAVSQAGLQTACAGMRLVQADTPGLIEAFASVLAANWSPPEEAVFAFYRAATPLLLQEQSPMRLFVAFAGDRPVSCGELFLSHGGQAAGLHSICTCQAFRRKGLGTAMSAALLHAGQSLGASHAVLLASADGAPVYRGLGFTSCGAFHEYAFAEEIVHP